MMIPGKYFYAIESMRSEKLRKKIGGTFLYNIIWLISLRDDVQQQNFFLQDGRGSHLTATFWKRLAKIWNNLGENNVLKANKKCTNLVENETLGNDDIILYILSYTKVIRMTVLIPRFLFNSKNLKNQRMVNLTVS